MGEAPERPRKSAGCRQRVPVGPSPEAPGAMGNHAKPTVERRYSHGFERYLANPPSLEKLEELLTNLRPQEPAETEKLHAVF